MTTFKDSIHRKVLGSLSAEQRPRTKYIKQQKPEEVAEGGTGAPAEESAEGEAPPQAAQQVPPQAQSVPAAAPPGVG